MKTGYLETGKSRQCSTHADHKSGRRDERLRVSSYVDGRLWLGALVPGNKQEDRSRVLVPRTHSPHPRKPEAAEARAER